MAQAELASESKRGRSPEGDAYPGAARAQVSDDVAHIVGILPASLARGSTCRPIRRPRASEFEIQIHGNTHGLKARQANALERLARRRLAPDQLISNEFARQLTELSREIRRQVGVLVDRRGEVTHVMVGSAHGIELPDWGRLRAGRGRLRGLRCIHTHLREEGLTRDDLTDLALLRLDAMVSIAVLDDGLPGLAHTATLRATQEQGEDPTERMAPTRPADIDFDLQVFLRDLEADLARLDVGRDIGDGERAILVAVTAGRNRDEFEIHLDELRELARSAGVEVVDVVTQAKPRPDAKTVIGSGKLDDLAIRSFQNDVDLVIFDQTLTPTQARNLADRMELRVIDRTQLILDIFAQHATSRDGKLQVELAQLEYRMPRLAQRADLSLSRLAGGIGGRGPGETKLETDRRRTRDRVTRLKRDLDKLASQRSHRRQRRDSRGVPVLSIVGYTNAGKSTLIRSLTKTEVLVEDKMFATLDPVSRRLRFPQEREVIITDTVGFIRDLPPELLEAFRATLEELSDASLLLHVVDASAEDFERRIESVRSVVREIGLGSIPELLVFNQIDKLPPGMGETLARRYEAVAVSATERIGFSDLLEQAEALLWHDDLSDFDKRRLEGLAAQGA
ncbi:MAG: GTPase HflX [Myxococcota bacterium]|nr:GTPase HflX [Myxococcota bacterium]